MSRTATIILILVSALVFIGVGFAVGQVVQAAINTPGSADDPLVSQSYVEQLVGQRTAALQSLIEDLQAQIETLSQAQINPLPNNPSTPSTPVDPDPGIDPGPVDPDPGIDPGPVDPEPTGKVIEVTGSSVNVREGPSTDTAKIGSVVKGDELEYIGSEGDWYKIKTKDGKVGYIANYLGVLK